jgi:MFS family permease
MPRLPRAVWTLEAGALVNAFGSGIAFPFLIIYLHNVRGFGLGTAGLVVAAIGVSGGIAGPAAGPLLDRIGGRATLAGSLLVSAVAYAAVPLIHHPWQAFLFSAVNGVGVGTFWPSVTTLLAGLTEQGQRHHAYAVQRVAINLGLGLGGVTGGLIATTSNPTSFTVLFLVDAATFLGMIAVLPLVPEPEIGGETQKAGGGYLAVLRDRVFVGLIALNVGYITAGYATFELLPAFAKNESHVSERWIGVIFFASTLALVAAQLPVARFAEGRRRMAVLAAMPALFAAAWLVILAGGIWLDSTDAALVYLLAGVLYGLGSCFQGPTQGALIADLAPPRLRGRYMALAAASWEVGFVLGPAIGGFVLATEPLALWPIAACVCVVAIVATLALERSLPADLRRTPGG